MQENGINNMSLIQRKSKLVEDSKFLNGNKRDMRKKIIKSNTKYPDLKRAISKKEDGGSIFSDYDLPISSAYSDLKNSEFLNQEINTHNKSNTTTEQEFLKAISKYIPDDKGGKAVKATLYKDMKEAVKILADAGFSNTYIAGVMGNIGTESYFDPNRREHGGSGRGIFQYTPPPGSKINPRYIKYEKWLRDNKLTNTFVNSIKYLAKQFKDEDYKTDELNRANDIWSRLSKELPNESKFFGKSYESFYALFNKNYSDKTLNTAKNTINKWLQSNGIKLVNYPKVMALKDTDTWAREWNNKWETKDGTVYDGPFARTLYRNINEKNPIPVDLTTEHFMYFYERPSAQDNFEKRKAIANLLLPYIRQMRKEIMYKKSGGILKCQEGRNLLENLKLDKLRHREISNKSKNILSPKDYLQSYVDSEAFKNRAKNSEDIEQEIIPESYIANAKKDLDKVQIKDLYRGNPIMMFWKRFSGEPYGSIARVDTNDSNYNPDTKLIHIDKKFYSGSDAEDLDDAIAHEYGHAIDPLIKMFPRTNTGSYTNIEVVPERYKDIWLSKRLLGKYDNAHDASYRETYADLMALRYALYKSGIYDSRSSIPFTLEMLKRFKEQRNTKQTAVQRTLDTFSDEDIVRMMNIIADSGNNKEVVDMAKSGTKLIIKHQTGNKVRNLYSLVKENKVNSNEYRKLYSELAGNGTLVTKRDGTLVAPILDEVTVKPENYNPVGRAVNKKLHTLGTNLTKTATSFTPYSPILAGMEFGSSFVPNSSNYGNYEDSAINAGLELLPYGISKGISKLKKFLPTKNVIKSKDSIQEAIGLSRNTSFEEQNNAVFKTLLKDTKETFPNGKLNIDIQRRASKLGFPIQINEINPKTTLIDQHSSIRDFGARLKEGRRQKLINRGTAGNTNSKGDIAIFRYSKNGTMYSPEELSDIAAHENIHRLQAKTGWTFDKVAGNYYTADTSNPISKTLSPYLASDNWAQSVDEVWADLNSFRSRNNIGKRDLTDSEAMQAVVELSRHWDMSKFGPTTIGLLASTLKAFPSTLPAIIESNESKK